jgi:hypothetical protein
VHQKEGKTRPGTGKEGEGRGEKGNTLWTKSILTELLNNSKFF